MKELFREYREEDYSQCESLVNQAWGFDEIFAPRALSSLAKCMYTKGSVISSNYRMVVEVDDKVAGFLFGLNERLKKPGINILYRLSLLWKIIRVKSEKPKDKSELLNAIKAHEENRAKLVGRGRSEIILFVVAKEYRGKGFGKRLFSGFLSNCMENGVSSIYVETNTLGASRFYELLGFRHLGDFESPLHEFATQGGQACIYEYICK